jgi:predicted dehydrogenase
MDRTPVIMIGAGNVANEAHIPAWKKIREVQVSAVYDNNADNLHATARKWGIPRAYSDFEQMLETERQGIVDICTPPSSHADLAVRTLKQGHHVVLEKPIATSPQETETIRQELKKRRDEGIQLCACHTFLFEPQILALRALLQKTPIDILSVHIEMLHTQDEHMLSDCNHWVHSHGGRLAECVIHPVYMLRNLLGPLTLRDAHYTKKTQYNWVDRDEVHANFDGDGKFGSIYISFSSPRWTYPASVRIIGKNAIINLDGTNLTLVKQSPLSHGYLPGIPPSKIELANDSLETASQILKSTAQNTYRYLSAWKSGHETLLRSFVNSVQQGKNVPYDAEEACDANMTYLSLLAKMKE